MAGLGSRGKVSRDCDKGKGERRWRSWEVTFVQGLRYLAAKVLPLLEKCNTHTQLLTAHLSRSGSGFKGLLRVSFVSQLVGHVACSSLLPSVLCQLGESGLGKSTLVNSLFLTDLYKDRKLLNAEERINQTVEIVKHTVDIEEKGVKLKLTIVDTPGFGDAVNNTECWKPITDYIDQQFEQYFRDESGLNRKNIQDNRVHCCLYFISPFGHGLRPVDVEFMKALHEKVNIVPLIAKADCLIPSEIRKLKERIREEIDKFGIKVYQFPECDSDEDEEFKQQDRELKESAPFAVIGSNTVVEAKGQRVRGRLYPWGIVEVENQAHCDFVKLRNMLIRTHMHDLKDVTCDVHYENYRAQCIQQMTSKLTQDNRIESPIPILPLPTPDTETEKLIKMKDEELRRMQEMLQKMQQQMQDQ
uniref:Septin 5 n=1 Tax=Dromaius novaehollandiae TaxID=8790 RepID=A0A8C4J527_DRONO